MKNSIIILFIGLTACVYDPGYTADIVNNTNESITIEIKFDKEHLEQYWNGNSYMEFLRVYPNDGLMPQGELNKTTLTKTFRIEPNKYFSLESAVGYYPTFDLFERITIISSDTLIIDSKTDIKAAFEKVDKGVWQLRIN